MFKKPRQKGIVSTLLCCFRPNVTPPTEEQEPKAPKNLLPRVRPTDKDKMCMVIDLDETLVHSSFKPIENPDFVVPVEIDGTILSVYVLKRPFVDEFLQEMGKLYECVLFTASLPKYAGPVADLLDKWGVFRSRLYRESCVFYNGSYVKDLSLLGRDLKRVIIVDNSPASYFFHKNNAVPVTSWFDDMSDTELRDLIPFFQKLSSVENVYTVLTNANDANQAKAIDPDSESQHLEPIPNNDSSPITQVSRPKYSSSISTTTSSSSSSHAKSMYSDKKKP